MRRKIEIAFFAALLALGAGCSGGVLEEPVHRMGELTTVGPLTYNVLETEWRAQLGDSIEAKIPENRFLLIRLSISNAGQQQVAVPLLTLEDEEGNSYMEVSEIEGLPNWLGLLRILEPAGMLEGVIVFDVPPSDYRLRVTDGGDLESERTALIEIPLTLAPPPPVETPAPGEQSF